MYIPKGKTIRTGDTKKTRFERDYKDAEEGNGIEVITKRRAEIEKLIHEGKSCKNSFRRTCIAQDVVRFKTELEKIEELF